MKKKFACLAMAMVMVLSLAACGGKKEEAPAAAPAESGSDSSVSVFKVGTIGPLSGDAAIYGQAVANGAKIAVDEINAAGGAIQFELQSQDDEADGEKSVNAYNTLVCRSWSVPPPPAPPSLFPPRPTLTAPSC